MLRANIGVSRKVSRDYQSSGYTVNLDGEIPFGPEDAEGVLEKIRELFDLAHEAIEREIDRDQGDAAVSRRDEPTPAPVQPAGPAAKPNNRITRQPTVIDAQPSVTPQRLNGSGSPNGHRNGSAEAASSKQCAFIYTIAKRLRLSAPQIGDEIKKIIGRECGVYDLTKKEAGLVLDYWTTQLQA